MTLKIINGINHLSAAPAKFKFAAVIIFAIMGIAIIVPRGVPVSTAGIAERPIAADEPRKETKNRSPVEADKAVIITKPENQKKTAKIVTCPRCRLNSLPLVKEFVYEHATLFEPNLKVDFKLGEDPVLHLYDDGKEVKSIDLASYDTRKIIQKLIQFGIMPKSESDVVRNALAAQSDR